MSFVFKHDGLPSDEPRFAVYMHCHAGEYSLEASPWTSRGLRRIISTLKRENLHSSDFIDISETKKPSVFVASSPEEKGQTKGLLGARRLHLARLLYPPDKFPQNTKGLPTLFRATFLA